ncbi:MAG: FliI/YscN family ATPase [Proteobacteria bacterium]|nr:FliI/YscN family ATPase [Pseudomonadota bacterium]
MVDLDSAFEMIEKKELRVPYGKVVDITGIIVRSAGIRASIGDPCVIYTDDGLEKDAEVVGFKDDLALLMIIGDLKGIKPGNRVKTFYENKFIKVSESLIGRIVNDKLEPLDDKGRIEGEPYPIYSQPPHPLKRKRINTPIDLGIRAINGLLTCGKGQRIGIMAGAGVGKSVLMGMIAKYTEAPVTVVALIGERGREVREFIEKDLGEEGLKKSIVVVATADQPPLSKIRAAYVATSIAEYFRDKGMDVLLLMDSLTRVAMAQREIGLAVGEPPTTKGYTPSVFAMLPKLLERAGTSEGKGSITGIYTVLVEGDDLNDPVSDSARAILDGHIVLSRELAMENHYPAIDVLASISRLMNDIVTEEHKKLASRLLEIYSIYKNNEDMIKLGLYKQGSDPKIDYAISLIDRMKMYLKQDIDEKRDIADSIQGLVLLLNEK